MAYEQINWTKENVAKFWDYTSQFPELYFTYRCGGSVVKKFKKYLKKDCNVLDYGCGTGFLIPHLLKFGVNVTGLDFSDKSVESVNKKFSGEPYFKGAFKKEDIIKKGLKFDVIFLLEVIEHLDDEYLEKTFEDIKKLLTENGVVVITTPNDEKLADNHIFCPQCECVFHRWQHVRSWDEIKLRGYLEEQGFKIVGLFTTDFSAFSWKNKFDFIKHIVKRMLGCRAPKLACVCKI